MTKNSGMETFIRIDDKPEASEVIEFMQELTPKEKKDFLLFIQGIKFARGFKTEHSAMKLEA